MEVLASLTTDMCIGLRVILSLARHIASLDNGKQHPTAQRTYMLRTLQPRRDVLISPFEGFVRAPKSMSAASRAPSPLGLSMRQYARRSSRGGRPGS